MYCQRCGKELAPDAAYCHNCGAKVGESSPSDWWWERQREWRERRRERWERRDWEPLDAAWGAISGFGYLIIIGLTVFWYPDVLTLTIKYLESWGTYGHPVLPSSTLGKPIIFLFATSGAWGIVSNGLRLALTSRVARPARGIAGALFSLYFAFILDQFYAKALGGAGLVLAFFVGLAAVVLADAMIWHFLPRRKPAKQPPAT